MISHFVVSLRVLLACTLLLGLGYPLLVTGVVGLVFSRQAGGSLVLDRTGKAVGSELIAQKFTSPRYFWPRPSAADFATLPSGASNLGPTSAKLRGLVAERRIAWQGSHGPETPPPPEILATSGSGLDPHLSPDGAKAQATRVAKARGLPEAQVLQLIDAQTEGPQGGVLGEPRVNVLLLNLALDALE